MAFSNSFIICSVFGGVMGDNIKLPVPPFDPEFNEKDPFFAGYNQRVFMNWIGANNHVGIDQFISMSMA